MWLNDLDRAVTRRLTVGAEAEHWPVLNRDGSSVYFRVFDADRRRQVFRVSSNGSPPTLIGPDIGNMTAITSDERYLLGMQRIDGRMALIAFDQETGSTTTIAAHEDMNIYAPRLSADDKWICFQTRHPDDSVQIYVASFDAEGARLEESDWTLITRGKDRNRKAIFSADAESLFYVSDRDGFDCIWRQQLARDTRAAVGEPRAIRHFHQSTTALTHVGEADQQLAVGGDTLIYNAAEISGNVWLMTPRD